MTAAEQPDPTPKTSEATSTLAGSTPTHTDASAAHTERAVREAAPVRDVARPVFEFNADAIPRALRDLQRWVCFKLTRPKKKGDKWGKVPVDPKTGRNAKSTDPKTWSTLDRALARVQADQLDGVGIVFAGDGITGIDLDHVRDATTGVVEPWARKIIDDLASYTEISPSGTGVHVIVFGKLPPLHRRRGNIEMYDAERFFTVTGIRVPGTSAVVEARQVELDRLHAAVFADSTKSVVVEAANKSELASESLDDRIIRRACEAKNGDGFRALWSGDTAGYDSPSEAELALCSHLSFWTGGNALAVDRLFRRSKLMRPKWDERHGERTYGEITVAKAVQLQHGRVRRIEVVPGKLPEAVRDAHDLLAGISPPEFFQRDGVLLRVVRLPEARELDGIARPDGAMTLNVVNEHYLGLRLTELAEWWVQKREDLARANAPKEVVLKLLASAGRWKFPQLLGIVEAPTLRADGSILEQPGYDQKSKLFFDSGGIDFGTLVQNPTREQARAALAVLLAPFSEFPFVAESDRAALLAAILTAVVRRALITAPMFIFDARTMSTGKSLLADAVSIIATGRPCSVMTQSYNASEEKKKYFSILLQGDAVASIDNVDRPLGSAELCAMLTASVYEDRILGSSKVIAVPNRTLWLANGNNVVVSGDLITRVVLCDLDAKCEAPQKREFENDLRVQLAHQRPELVRAALTIMRAFVAAGRPKQAVSTFGRFESWSRLVREPLVWLGMPDPLDGVHRLQAQDPVQSRLSALLEAWTKAFGSEPISVAAALRHARTPGRVELLDAFFEIAGVLPDSIDPREIGVFIRSHRGRSVEGRSFESAGHRHGVTRWVVRGGMGGSLSAPRESTDHCSSQGEQEQFAHALEVAKVIPPIHPQDDQEGLDGSVQESQQSDGLTAQPERNEGSTIGDAVTIGDPT